MKKIIIFSFLFSISLFSKDLNWLSYSEGMLIKENKPKLYMLSATYCVYCKKNKDMMNEEKTLNEYINNNFITISQERDIENVPKYLDNTLTPIYYVLDNKGNIIGEPLRGSQDKLTLLKFLNKNLYIYSNKENK